nr:phospholipase-like protein [Tanacetum cinerariifolium]
MLLESPPPPAGRAFTRRCDDIDIQFGRDKFRLITGLKFGVGYSSDYEVDHIPFRRRVLNSDTYVYKITARMLEKKITSPEFAKLRHHDAVSLCLLALLECVLLCQELRHNVPDWCLRLVNDRVMWDLYSWGLYIRPSLYYSLRNANMKRWLALYAPPVEQVDKTPKYTMSGFTWAFKGALPIRRLTPDAIEARSDWCVSSRRFFDGLIREPPRIPSPGSPQGGPTLFTTPVSTFFFEGAQATPMSSRYMPSHPVTPNIMTPMPQQGFAPWSSPYQVTVDVGSVLLDSSSSEQVLSESVYKLTDTTVAPKKRPDKSKNKAMNGKALAFDLGNADFDDNVGVNEVLIMDAHATDDYICYKNVDPNKVYMPINACGDHWVTGVINLTCSRFFVLDSLESEGRKASIYAHIDNGQEYLMAFWKNNVILKESERYHTISNNSTIKAFISRPHNKQTYWIVEWLHAS